MNYILLLTLFCFTSCGGLFYYPDKYLYSTPDKQLKIKYNHEEFKSIDGTKLVGWHLLRSDIKKKEGLIVFFHGNAQNISSHYMNLGWITKRGYDVFIFDYRGYGLSEGSPNQKGTYLDGLAALNYGYDLYKKIGHKRFIVYGQSLGGAVSLRSVEDFRHKDEINLYVLDSTFSSYQDIGSKILRRSFLTYIFSPLSYLLLSDEYSGKNYVSKIDYPTLVIHGDQDKVVPYELGQELYSKLETKKKWWWSLEGGEHTDVFFNHKEKYKKAFLKLLKDL